MTTQNFRDRFPTLAVGMSDEDLLAYVNRGAFLINYIADFGELREEALGYLIAHLIHVDDSIRINGGESESTVTSTKIGNVSFTTKSEVGDRAWLDKSGWGQQFLALLDLIPQGSGAFVV